jgi:hypothetical protein
MTETGAMVTVATLALDPLAQNRIADSWLPTISDRRRRSFELSMA